MWTKRCQAWHMISNTKKATEWSLGDVPTAHQTLGEGDQRTKPRKRTVGVGESTHARH